MKLIIEGCDLSGKTYAIERIAKYFNSGFVLKNSYKPKTLNDSNKIYTQYWHLLALIKQANGLIILDRFFPSQAVYSIKRGKDEFNSKEIKELDDFCADHNFIYIYLDTEVKELQNRYEVRGDEHIKKNELKLIKERYDLFFETTNMNKLKVNTLEEGWLEKLADELTRLK